MAVIFDPNKMYLLGDPELEILGTRERLAQWRHHSVGPAWYKIGRKVAYAGKDLNAYLEESRTDPNSKAA